MLKFNDCYFYIRYTLRERNPTGDYFGKPYCKTKTKQTMRHAATDEVKKFSTFLDAVIATNMLIDSFKDEDHEVINTMISSNTKPRKENQL